MDLYLGDTSDVEVHTRSYTVHLVLHCQMAVNVCTKVSCYWFGNNVILSDLDCDISCVLCHVLASDHHHFCFLVV